MVEEPHYYVQKAPGAPLKELVITYQTLVQGERTYYQDIPTFRGVLNEQFSDCPGVLLSLGQTELRPTSLIAAVQRYNECRQPGSVAAQPPYKSTQWVGFEVLLGAQAGQLTFSGFNSPVNGNFRASLTPEAGVAVFISSRALRNKLQLRLEAHYARQHYEDEYPFMSTTGSGSPFLSPTRYQSRFQADYVRVPLLLRYLPFAGQVRPFLEAGGTVSPLLHLTQESQAYTPATATYGPWGPAYDSSIIRHMEYGWLAGVGVQTAGLAGHPVSVLGRLESSNGFLETTVNYNTATRYYLLLAIGLRKQQQ